MGRGSLDPRLWIEQSLIYGLPAAFVISAVVWSGQRWQSRHHVQPVSYVIFVVAAAFAGALVRASSGMTPVGPMSNPVTFSLAIVRISLMILIIMAVTGAITERLRRQIAETDDALALVREQQVIMLEADEGVRRQVAGVLHDRVQAGLVASCLELQMLASNRSGEERNEILSIVGRLEALRALDVKPAVRSLSPDLHNVDLQTAVEELAAQYEPGIGVRVKVSPEVDEQRNSYDPELPLAIYRIVEQALLNAAVHGKPQNVDVVVKQEKNELVVEVINDGQEISQERHPGLGTAILNTWSGLFNGTWNLEPLQGGGARLSVRLAKARSQ